MIPKKIHYCWFGKGQKNELFYKCFESWKKYFPDYEIIEWNEENFDINYNDYVRQAYECKKYAFVSDVTRLKVIYDYGGIYFDTDVEVLKKFNESILENGYFGEEREGFINTGIGFAANKKNKAVEIMLNDYNNIHFINDDGEMDLTPCTERNSNSLINRGYKIEAKSIIEKIPIYSKEYFCGFDITTHHYIISDKTYSVHHYNASWNNKKEKFINKIKRLISRIIGIDNYNILRKLKNKKMR